MFKKVDSTSRRLLDSVLQIPSDAGGCCEEFTGTPAKYVATIDFGQPIKALTIGGVIHDFLVPATDIQSFTAGAVEAFKSALMIDVGPYSGVGLLDAGGGNYTVDIFSNVAVASIIKDDNSTFTTTAMTTKFVNCIASGYLIGNPGTVSVEGTAPFATLANVPYDFSLTDAAANEATRSLLQTDLKTALDVAKPGNDFVVFVEVSAAFQKYHASVHNTEDMEDIYVGSTLVFDQSECRDDYKV